jgi:glucokinase
MTRGGVYVAGGIAPRLAPALADGNFVAAFRDKGVHAALMAAIPVDLVRDDRLGLTGAAALAAAQQG